MIEYQGSVTHACNESSRYDIEKLMARKSYTDRALEISKENQDKDSVIFWQQAVDHIDSLILKQEKK